MASYESFTQAAAKIKLPITGDNRNILTKLDDHGYFASLNRIEGESVSNFKARISSSYTRPANSTINGLTDGIARELSLGHEELIAVVASESIKLDIDSEFISVSGYGTNGLQKVPIVNVDVDGYWTLPTIGKVVSGLNNISGISATTTMATTPAVLLEKQSSYITEYSEQVPPSTSFRLGYYNYGQEINGTVISGTISFTDDITFSTEISGSPTSEGEWSLDQSTNTVRSYNLPTSPVNIIYTYNILESGMTMSLVGNGVKVMNLMTADAQNMLFHNSGIGATAQSIIDELRTVDGAFWGE